MPKVLNDLVPYKLIYLARRNPSIKEDDWPRTWRSHAVFSSQFPFLGPGYSRLMYCSRVREDGPQTLTRSDYDGVALVSCNSEDALFHRGIPPDVRAKIDQDELRVFSSNTVQFSFHCEELLALGAEPSATALIRFLVRKPELASAEFLERWGRQAERMTRAMEVEPGIVRCVHNGFLDQPPPGYPFDGVSETWFADMDAARVIVREGSVDRDDEALGSFCDLRRSVSLLTTVTHRWPRAEEERR